MIALYNKYRPQKFEDLFGQDHISQTLKNAIKGGTFAHAYLFTGPRGTGKTSVARILAKGINCEKNTGASPQGRGIKNANTSKVQAKKHLEGVGEPCGVCDNCTNITEGREVDIIEIDAASNRGIDEIRELREKIKFAPTNLAYKVFIIDEVHMLTREAFNALLKTLEEPPSHAVFVLATTEIHKIPQTVISRCQRFDFRRISLQDLMKRLDIIVKSEKISIDKKALSLIAETSEGGFRDAISYLDQISSYKNGEVSYDDVIDILGMTDFRTLASFILYLKDNKPKEALILLNDLAESGCDIDQFTKNTINFLRKLILIKAVGADEIELSKEHASNMQDLAEGFPFERITKIIEDISELSKAFSGSSLPQLALELTVLRTVKPEKEEKTAVKNIENINKEYLDSAPVRTENGRTYKPQNEIKTISKTALESKPEIASENIEKSTKKVIINDDESAWQDFMIELKSRNSAVHAFVKACKPIFEEETAIFNFPYKFHRDKVNDIKNKKLVEELLEMIYNKPYKLKCVLKEGKAVPAPKKEEKLVSTALEIFGGEIVD